MPVKQRLDLLVVEKGLAPSRQRARALIMAGKILVDCQRIDKPGAQVPVDADISVKGEDLAYVSRGGLKLEGALRAMNLDVRGWGASLAILSRPRRSNARKDQLG